MLRSVVVALLTAIVLTEIAAFATSIYLHRGLTHRALTVHPALDVVFRFVLWILTGQRPQEWVAVHRKHHAFTDKEGDPHSPRLLGFWRVQILNVVYYMREAKNPQTIARFAPDVVGDRLDGLIFNHGKTGLAVGVLLACLVLGPTVGLLASAMHAAFYVFLLAPAINALGHLSGQKNFENTAFNLRWLAWLTAGEGLHNNHHAHPQSPKFSARSSEFDPSWPIIRMLGWCGLLSFRTR